MCIPKNKTVNFDLSVSSRRDFKGSLREGAPAERVEEHAQQTLVRLDMASASRLYRRLLPSPCGATSLSEGGLYCDRKQDGVIFKGFSEM